MTQRRNHPLRRWTTGLTALALLLSAYGAGGFRPQAEETSSLSAPEAESAAAGIPSYADYRQRQAPAPSGSFVLEAGAGYTAAGASPVSITVLRTPRALSCAMASGASGLISSEMTRYPA